MAFRELSIGIVLLSQIVLGILGNFSLLYYYLFLYFTGHRLKLTDLIISHLMVANSLTLLSRGIPQTMEAFGLKFFLSDIGCKLVFYLHRVGRGVSISSTCLLSVFQAIKISPRNSRWAELKVKAPKYIGFCIFLCWVLQMLLNITSPIYVTGKWDNRNATMRKDLGFCSAEQTDIITVSLYAVLLLFPDISSLGVMIWASSFMVFILYRHRQKVQHIHKTNIFPRSFPESRATQRILILVNIFVSFYFISAIIQVCISHSHKPSWLLVKISAPISVCFPTFYPFVFMSHCFSVSRVFVQIRNTKPPDFARNT
jgi:vomeronasal1 receptor